MKTVDDFNYNNQKVLVRVDFNVPLDEKYNVTDNTRIVMAKPTIEKILKDGGSVILMSHLGRPKGPDEKFSLKHIIPEVEKVLGKRIIFSPEIIGPEVKKKAGSIKKGEVMLLENLRFDPREKKGDVAFARELAALADAYVNDAFGTAHRAHASTTVVARFFPGKKAAGYLLANEVKNIKKALEEGEHPITAIIGGAKVSSKLGVIKNLMDKVDNLIIVGGMAYTFLKALGKQTGKSLVEDDLIDEAKNLMKYAKEKGVDLVLPVDFIVADDFSPGANTKIVDADHIPEEWMGLDIGPETINLLDKVIKQSKTIIWNGPAGVFEWDAFSKGTRSIAQSIAEATNQGAFSLVGGGDSVAAVKKYGLQDKISYISTGGGAMLEMLEGKDLPAIKALED